MKKDDAIAILQGVANHLISGEEIRYSDKLMLALDVAIDALKEVKNQNEELNNSNDLISRAVAIDAFRPYAEYESNRSNVDWVRRIEMTLNDLPSVQPEEHTQERTETHACDCIERQAVIEALEKVAELFPWRVPGNRDSYDRYNEAWNDAIGRAEIEIEELPSAQPEIIRCKDCKHFEYDHPYVIHGVPVLRHEVCNAWGDGCKTDENGYCFLAERRTDEV